MFHANTHREPAMHTYMISCDLTTAPQENSGLLHAIKGMAQAWARPLEMTWYVRTVLDIAEVETRLGAQLELEDCVLIQPVNAEAAMLNTTLRWFSPRGKAAPSPIPVLAEHRAARFAQA